MLFLTDKWPEFSAVGREKTSTEVEWECKNVRLKHFNVNEEAWNILSLRINANF